MAMKKTLVLLCLFTILVVSVPSCESKKLIEEDVIAKILTKKDHFHQKEEIIFGVIIKNAGKSPIYILKESACGPVWNDRKGKRIVVAHWAYENKRFNELTGGYLSYELYLPDFYKLKPGKELKLLFSAGKGHESGIWKIDGKIAVFHSIDLLENLGGEEAKARMVKLDTIIACIGKEIEVLRSP